MTLWNITSSKELLSQDVLIISPARCSEYLIDSDKGCDKGKGWKSEKNENKNRMSVGLAALPKHASRRVFVASDRQRHETIKKVTGPAKLLIPFPSDWQCRCFLHQTCLSATAYLKTERQRAAECVSDRHVVVEGKRKGKDRRSLQRDALGLRAREWIRSALGMRKISNNGKIRAERWRGES